jgi:hypothetical protein
MPYTHIPDLLILKPKVFGDARLVECQVVIQPLAVSF